MNLQKFIQKLPLDKKEHVILGLIYGIVLVFSVAFLKLWWLTFCGFLIATLLNTWKELIHDWKKGKGNPEFNDWIATEIPILIIYVTTLI